METLMEPHKGLRALLEETPGAVLVFSSESEPEQKPTS